MSSIPPQKKGRKENEAVEKNLFFQNRWNSHPQQKLHTHLGTKFGLATSLKKTWKHHRSSADCFLGLLFPQTPETVSLVQSGEGEALSEHCVLAE